MAAPMKVTSFRFVLKDNIFLKLVRRPYSRGSRSMSVKVMTPEQEREKLGKMGVNVTDPRTNAHIKYLPDDPVQKSMKHRNEHIPQNKGKSQESIYQKMALSKVSRDEINGIQYTKIQDEDISKKFSQIMMKTKSKKEREKRREIILGGRRLIIDALKANVVMKALYFSRTELLENFPSEWINCPVFKVPYKDFKLWTDTETPQGILAIVDMPGEGETNVQRTHEFPITVICDQVTDPGNMGTLIRTAAAVGCHKFITMKGSVDVWDSKVIRAGAGGHFRMPIINSLSWSYVSNYIPDNSSIFVADCRRPSEWTLENVTSADGDINDEILDDKKKESFLEEDEKSQLTIDQSFMNKNRLKMYEEVPLSVSLYSEMDFTAQGHTVLIVGGETKGISVQSRKLAFDNYGQCVMLPMATGVNSLNSSIAGSVLLYEIHRQYSEKVDTSSCEQVVEKSMN